MNDTGTASMSVQPLDWSPGSVCLQPAGKDAATVAGAVHDLACRTGFHAPGFCLIDALSIVDAVSLRRFMIDLKLALARVHLARAGDSLVYLAMSRFDQRSTTRLHLDGGPDESLLMLGYEPSDLESRIEIADYARCAYDLGITPKEFLSRHNPMFSDDAGLLRPYTVQLPGFSPEAYQVVCINNSSARYAIGRPTWQGVLHAARIGEAAGSGPRMVNSTLIGVASGQAADVIGASGQTAFIDAAGSGDGQLEAG